MSCSRWAAFACASLALASDGIAADSHRAADRAAADSYQFPILPGTPAWRALKDHDAKLVATRVPPEILSAMSTAGVVETCLAHPLLIELGIYSSPQAGFDRAGASLDVVQELLTRPDAGRRLLEAYEAIDPSALPPTTSSLEQGRLSLQIGYLELILAQRLFLSAMTRAERQNVLRETTRMVDAQVAHLGEVDLSSTALLIGRVLEAQGLLEGSSLWAPGNRERTNDFLRSGFGADDVLIGALVDLARRSAQAPELR